MPNEPGRDVSAAEMKGESGAAEFVGEARGMLRVPVPPTKELPMSEHEHTEANSHHRHSMDPQRGTGGDHRHDGLLAGAADALSDAHAAHPARRSHFPKDDRRSSARLTEREQSERWPLG
jgi:hypothetical protein